MKLRYKLKVAGRNHHYNYPRQKGIFDNFHQDLFVITTTRSKRFNDKKGDEGKEKILVHGELTLS